MKRVDSSGGVFGDELRNVMARVSPLALAVVFEQIKRGTQIDIEEAFQMEYGISQRFMQHSEFFEGVRALLVEKDKNPVWKHQCVHDVSQEEV